MRKRQTLHPAEQPPGNLKSWIVWALAATFYLYEYFVRVAPAVMSDELMMAFQVRSAQLGGAIAAYHYIYAPMQLFAGFLFDRFGGRRILIPATLFVAIGCLIAIIPCNQLWIVTVSRLFMGFGSAFGFIGVLYLASIWFPHNQLALIAGLTTTLGMAGAIVGEAPLSHAVDFFGWKECLLWTGFAGFILALCMFLGIPETPDWEKKRKSRVRAEREEPIHFVATLMGVLKNPQTWIIGFVASCLFMPLIVFADLWGVQYIVQVCSTTKAKAAGGVSMLYLGWLVGSPLAGIVSDKLQRRKMPLRIACLLSTIVLLLICLDSEISLRNMYILLFILGLTSCIEVISFVACIEINDSHAKGTAVAACNMIVMCIGGLLQHGFGVLLDLIEDIGGVCSCSMDSYKGTILLLPAMMILGLIASFFMKETYQEFERK